MTSTSTNPSTRIEKYRSIKLVLRALLLIAAVVPAALIAKNSRTNVHPDENMHVDAFRWYAHHWFRPEPGDRRLKYSAYGWSRVFTDEAVYFIYGRVGAVVDYFDPAADENLQTAFHVYRYINIAVLALTLGVLLFGRTSPWFSPAILACVIIAVPQAVYIYAYANSDGWGLSTNLWLLAFTAALERRGIGKWSVWHAAGWWGLFLLVLLAKTPFRLGILIPLAIMIEAMIAGRAAIPRPRLAWWATRIIVPAIVVYTLAAWWDPALGPWHAEWKAQLWDARQQTAEFDLRGEVPEHWGSNRAGKGNNYRWLFEDTQFIEASYQSAYDRMGGWLPPPPEELFVAAGWLLAAGIAVNLLSLATCRRRVPAPLVIAMALSPFVVAINFIGHAWMSLHVDFQPQGRYLFPCLIPVYFLWAGAMPVEPPWMRRPHAAVFLGAAMGLSMYHLWKFGVYNPLLNAVVGG
jgi:hypothetical protein